MDRTGVDCLLSGFIEIFLMMFQTKIIKPDVGDRTNNTRETARAGLSVTKCDLKRIPDLETAIREGIESEAGKWLNSLLPTLQIVLPGHYRRIGKIHRDILLPV